ncbi:hypothetical protein ACQBAR_15690 [Propionibacteriaceae bacterium Y1685]
MSDNLSHDIQWFNVQIQAWRQYHNDMDAMLSMLRATPEIPDLSERFPPNLADGSVVMREACANVQHALDLAQQSATAFAEALHATADTYVRERESAEEAISGLRNTIAQ